MVVFVGAERVHDLLVDVVGAVGRAGGGEEGVTVCVARGEGGGPYRLWGGGGAAVARGTTENADVVCELAIIIDSGGDMVCDADLVIHAEAEMVCSRC